VIRARFDLGVGVAPGAEGASSLRFAAPGEVVTSAAPAAADSASKALAAIAAKCIATGFIDGSLDSSGWGGEPA